MAVACFPRNAGAYVGVCFSATNPDDGIICLIFEHSLCSVCAMLVLPKFN